MEPQTGEKENVREKLEESLEESFGGSLRSSLVLQVRRKVEVCRQVLEVLDLIDPGGCDSDCDRWL